MGCLGELDNGWVSSYNLIEAIFKCGWVMEERDVGEQSREELEVNNRGVKYQGVKFGWNIKGWNMGEISRGEISMCEIWVKYRGMK